MHMPSHKADNHSKHNKSAEWYLPSSCSGVAGNMSSATRAMHSRKSTNVTVVRFLRFEISLVQHIWDHMKHIFAFMYERPPSPKVHPSVSQHLSHPPMVKVFLRSRALKRQYVDFSWGAHFSNTPAHACSRLTKKPYNEKLMFRQGSSVCCIPHASMTLAW